MQAKNVLTRLGIDAPLLEIALTRTAGWVSHWLELQEEGHGIDHPRQLYIGKTRRPYPGKP